MDGAPRLVLGQVMHRRLRPARHAFAYPVFYVELPLRDLAAAARWPFSIDRANLLSFYTSDHGPRDGSPLLPWIEGLLAAHGLPTGGAIVLQTFPRVLGYVFKPVSFWYCHDRAGALVAILAEVNNTFGATHSYLLHHGGAPLADGAPLQARKEMPVSPFNRTSGHYQFHFRCSGERRLARVDYADADGAILLTSLSGRARAWSAWALLAAFLRMPLLTLGITLRIHWQALRLWCKRLPFHGAGSRPADCIEPP